MNYFKYSYGIKEFVDNASKYNPATGEVVTTCADAGLLVNEYENEESAACITYDNCQSLGGYIRWSSGGDDKCLKVCASGTNSYAVQNGSYWQCTTQCYQYAPADGNGVRRCRSCYDHEIRVGNECLDACPTEG